MFNSTVVVPFEKIHSFEVGTVADYLIKVQESHVLPLWNQQERIAAAAEAETCSPRMTLRSLLGLDEGLTMSQAFA